MRGGSSITFSDGLVVSRSEQYGIQDASNEHKTQWQGSLNRARHLYMVGEVKRAGTDGIVYLEWLYDRKKNGQLVMHARPAARRPHRRCRSRLPRCQPYRRPFSSFGQMG